MKNIHLLPTDKPSRLILQGSELVLSKYKEVNEGFSEFNQHIYITSDEEIKEGDWVLNSGDYDKDIVFKADERFFDIGLEAKKIILTTDQDLIKDGVQAVDDEFLEWFVKNPSCEEVEVDKVDIEQPKPLYSNGKHKGERIWLESYKIIIPKEESKQEKDDSYIKEQKERRRKLFNLIDELEEKKLQEEPKQETLEEFIQREGYPEGHTQDIWEDGVRRGINWQQEQILQFLYSEITERRPYSSSKMCEKVIEFIEQLNIKK